jgi:DNA-binding response OmpR family regulator
MPPETADARRSVLIVEDDPAVARILRVCLRRAGFETVQADTGGEALKQMDEAQPDAVLLDLGLPDGRGGAVLHRLQESGGDPAWLIVSALDEDEAVRRYGPLKGSFIPKPFDPWDLIRHLETLLDHGNKGPGA